MFVLIDIKKAVIIIRLGIIGIFKIPTFNVSLTSSSLKKMCLLKLTRRIMCS